VFKAPARGLTSLVVHGPKFIKDLTDSGKVYEWVAVVMSN